MKIPARIDYALRAVIELAAGHSESVSVRTIAKRQGLSERFLEQVFTDLRAGGLVTSRRGGHGGYQLVKPAHELSVADVICAVHPEFTAATTSRPPTGSCPGTSQALATLWLALSADLQDFLHGVTVGDVAKGQLPGWAVELAERGRTSIWT